MSELYDVVIVGGGPGGLAAALYAKRYAMKVLVLAKDLGGLITTTHIVENYPGIKPMSGLDMMDIFLEQIKSLEVELKEVEVTKLERKGEKGFSVYTKDECYEAKSVIFATGTKHRELAVPGEVDYRNKGVSYCATCDGPFFKGKPIAIVGGGDSAAKEALLLADYGSHVYIISLMKFMAEPINRLRVEQKSNITLIEDNTVVEVHGDGNKLTHVTLKKPYNGSDKLDVSGVFVAIGHLAQTELAKPIGVAMNGKGEIKIDKCSRTSVPLFYAAGDCTNTKFKQAIISAAEGSQAANSAYEDLTNDHVMPCG